MSRPPSTIRAAALAVAATGVLLAGALWGWTPDARAHAAFRSVAPADGASVAEAPGTIVITFTKSVEGNVRDVVLVPPSGPAIRDAWTVDGARIIIDPPRSMAAGTWGVEWRVTGADGHPLAGTSRFAIGAGAAAAPRPASSSPTVRVEHVALLGRILFFGGLLLSIGGITFAIVAAPGWRPRFWSPSVVSVIVGAWIVVASYVALVDARSWSEMSSISAWLDAATSVACRGYVVAAIVMAALHATRTQLRPSAWSRRDGRAPRLQVFLVLVAVSAPATSGHAVDGGLLWLRMPIDALHVLAGAAWLGGLVQMLTIVVRRRAVDPRMSAVVDRYATVAAVAVGVLAATGIYATLDELGAGLGELVGSTWGRLVLAKVALLAATLPLANANRIRNVPGIGDDPARNMPRLRRFVALELLIIIWVVGATALLVYEVPPIEEASTEARAAASAVTVGDLSPG